MSKKLSGLFVGLVFALSASVAQAILMDVGGGMIYDSEQDLTWLQDTRYARTQYVESGGTQGNLDGRMDWDEANAWVDGLVYGGYDDWRMPRVTDTGPTGCDWAYSGTDCGLNVDTSTGELAYMFHNILGNESWYLPDETRNLEYCSPGTPYCLQNTSADGVDILNFPLAGSQLRDHPYWASDSENPDEAWSFDFSAGVQVIPNQTYWVMDVWAVRDGNVATIPEPSILALLSLGLVGIGFTRRKVRT